MINKEMNLVFVECRKRIGDGVVLRTVCFNSKWTREEKKSWGKERIIKSIMD
jgi:hypothetical protein